MAANGNSSDVKNTTGKVSVSVEEVTFLEKQKLRLREIEKKIEEDARRRRREWEKEVDRMKEEFLKLHPADKEWGSEELLSDPLVYRRRGSTDVLDSRKMKTLFSESPYAGCKYKLRFDAKPYERDSIEVQVEKANNRIVVSAIKKEEGSDGLVVERQYCRKIEKPHEVDADKLRSCLTKDGVLIVEAALPPHTLNFNRKFSGSPSHSINSSHSMQSCSSSRSRSPSGSPHTPSAMARPGVPVFAGATNERQMSLVVEVGPVFKPPDVCVQVLTGTRIMVKAKHEERTSERFSKTKFHKEFELGEKIEPYSMRAGITEDGKVLIGALGRDHDKVTKGAAGKLLAQELASKSSPCNVLDLARFPPTPNPQTPSSS